MKNLILIVFILIAVSESKAQKVFKTSYNSNLILVQTKIQSGIYRRYSCSDQFVRLLQMYERYKSEADKIIFVTEYRSEADMIVYETKYQSEAKPYSGSWFWTQYKSVADWVVYFTKYKSEATLVVFFSKYQSEAGMKQ